METDNDFGDLALDVMADRVGNDFLLKAAKIVVSGVFQELSSVVRVLDFERIATKQVQDVGKDLGGAVGDAWRVDCWWTEETARVEAWKDIARRAEEDGEAQREIVGSVADGGEDVAWDTEVFVADFDKDLGFEELRSEARYWNR